MMRENAYLRHMKFYNSEAIKFSVFSVVSSILLS